MTEGGINLVYGILALIAAVMMFVLKKGIDYIPLDQVEFNKWLAASLAFIVGAAGAFLVVPIMLVVLKSTRVTIASSLAMTFLSSIGATIGKIIIVINCSLEP